jgi:hypothetical protein
MRELSLTFFVSAGASAPAPGRLNPVMTMTGDGIVLGGTQRRAKTRL